MAFLVFDDFIDVAHGVVVDVLKSGNQAQEYGVEFGFQFLSFRAAAKERKQSTPQVVIAEVGERVFNLDLVGGNRVSDFGGCCHGSNDYPAQK